MQNTNGNQLISFPGSMGPHTGAAVERLKHGQPGDKVTRDEMAKVVGRDCRPGNAGYSNVASAINHCESLGVVWEWSRAEQAYICLNEAAKVGTWQSYRQSARRRVRRGRRRLASVDRRKLNEQQRNELTTGLIIANMMLTTSSNAVCKRLHGASDLKQPSARKLIELMKPKK